MSDPNATMVSMWTNTNLINEDVLNDKILGTDAMGEQVLAKL